MMGQLQYRRNIIKGLSLVSWATLQREQALAAVPTAIAEQWIGGDWADDALSSVFDQQYVAAAHNLGRQLSGQGVRFGDLIEIQKSDQQEIIQLFGQLCPIKNDPFIALNTALWTSGTLVVVPENVVCSTGLQAIRSHATVPFDRQLVLVREGAKLEYSTGCLSEAQPRRQNLIVPVVEILVRTGAKLTFVDLENQKSELRDLGRTVIRLEAGAELMLCSARLGRTSYAHPLVIEADPTAMIAGHMLDVALESPKTAAGVHIHGAAESSLQFYGFSAGNSLQIASGRDSLSCTYIDPNDSRAMLTEDQLHALLSPFPMEVAAEIQVLLER